MSSEAKEAFERLKGWLAHANGPNYHKMYLINAIHDLNTIDEALSALEAERGDGPERYWLIEQTDLDEDDDHRVIHTTYLNVYPDAKILGEYVRVEPHPPAVAGDMLVEVAIVRHALNDKYGEGYACHNALNRIEAALTPPDADLAAVRAELEYIKDSCYRNQLGVDGVKRHSHGVRDQMASACIKRADNALNILNRMMKGE